MKNCSCARVTAPSRLHSPDWHRRTPSLLGAHSHVWYCTVTRVALCRVCSHRELVIIQQEIPSERCRPPLQASGIAKVAQHRPR